MDSIFIGTGNIVIVKPSSSSYYSERAEAKEAYLDIWERRGGERRGEDRIERVRY